MNRIQIVSEIECFDSPEDLIPEERLLLQKAVEAARNAWAPYSEFFVGAGLKLADGTMFTGSNQENAAFPSGLCAERVALFHAGHAAPGITIHSIAVTAWSEKHNAFDPVSPCGACLQVMAEYERKQGSPLRILWHGMSGKVHACTGVKNLLPVMFELKS